MARIQSKKRRYKSEVPKTMRRTIVSAVGASILSGAMGFALASYSDLQNFKSKVLIQERLYVEIASKLEAIDKKVDGLKDFLLNLPRRLPSP